MGKLAKSVFAAIMAIALVLSFAACSTGTETTETSESAEVTHKRG